MKILLYSLAALSCGFLACLIANYYAYGKVFKFFPDKEDRKKITPFQAFNYSLIIGGLGAFLGTAILVIINCVLHAYFLH